MTLSPLKFAVVVMAAVLLAPAAYSQDVTPEEARAIAKEAYIYGYPLVDNYLVSVRLLRGQEQSQFQGALEPSQEHQ